MANNVWNNSQANNDGNDPLNWSLGWVPKAGDDALFNATSVADCNINTASIVCDNLTVTSAYSGTLSLGAARSWRVTGGVIDIDGNVSLGSVAYLYVHTGTSLNIRSNADISGIGYLYVYNGDIPIFEAGGRVRCGWIECAYNFASKTIAAGTYETLIRMDFGTWAFGAGSFTVDNLELFPNSGAVTLDLGTNNPTVTILGDFTIDINGANNAVIAASSNAIVLQGDLIDEITGGGTFTADSQDLTLSGTANQSIDGCGGTWGTIVVNKTAGTVTLTGTLTCGAFTGTDGTLDFAGETLTASGAVSLADGFGVIDGIEAGYIAAGSTVNCDTFTADNVDLVGSATWYLNCTTSGTLHNLTITNCDASGGVEIDATDNCVDGGGNSNIDFGAVALAPWEIAAWNTPFEAGAWR
ncbi:MAG: hypothetical protein ACYTFQ_29170 [Planctomycetota bacterium]|jgi:hypothetical protein